MTAAVIPLPKAPHPYWSGSGVTIYHGDCFELLPQLRADVTITDPPYMFGLASVSSGTSKVSKFTDLLNQSFFFREILLACFGSMPVDCAVWMFTSWRSLPVLMKGTVDAGRNIDSLLIWDKGWIGPGGKVGLRPSYEACALIPSGNFALPNRGLPDVWRQGWSSTKPNGHPAEKPKGLLARLIHETPGEMILDPFMGSGTTLRAAKEQKRRAIGIESEEQYCEIAARRLERDEYEISGAARREAHKLLLAGRRRTNPEWLRQLKRDLKTI